MLIEHDCICLVDLRQESASGRLNLFNETDNCLSVGLAQCSIKGADTFKLNEHSQNGPYILVANK
jgi:hypothetical protein